MANDVIPITVARAAREFSGKVIDQAAAELREDTEVVRLPGIEFDEDYQRVRDFYARRRDTEGDAEFARRIVAETVDLTLAERLYLLTVLDEEIAKRVGGSGA